tara:strand:- start:312 stop:809 length:498 start_codon:yes stop_codon:yes gene_type:complete
MNTYVFYDSYGQIISTYGGAQPEIQTIENAIGYALVDSNYVSSEDTYYDITNKKFAAKTITDLNIPDRIKKDAAVTFTVPADCYVLVNDIKHTSGNITLDTSKVDGILISVKGKLKYEKFLKITTYYEDRMGEYPSIKDQLDEIYHNGIDGWKTKIKAVKDKYPK